MVLVEALRELGTVFVAAPAMEQSWVGRGFSRHRQIAVTAFDGFEGVQAWTVDGTPSDAVNIALGHLLPKKPDVVVSGINIGWNAMVPVIYSSGTVAGALEGASWGIPAIAISIHLEGEFFDRIKGDAAHPPESIKDPLKVAAKLGAAFAAQKAEESNDHCEVYNLNFPTNPKPDTPWIVTEPGKIKFDSLFQEIKPGRYSFRYMEQISKPSGTELPCDYEVFTEGKISLSKLKFHKLS